MLKTVSVALAAGAAGLGNLTVTDNVTTITNVTQITINGGHISGSSANLLISTLSGSTPVVTPQGRLSLQSGKAVMVSNTTGANVVYYSVYVGTMVPIYDGTNWQTFSIPNGEISIGLDAVTPHIASGNLYDIFGINNSGSLAIGAGPAWSNSSAGSGSRGTGAGTTELQFTGGLLTNKNTLTHLWGGASGTTDIGPVSASQGLYLGTVYATANGQTQMVFKPTPASGGTNNFLGLYNAFNRVTMISRCTDNNSWSLANATWRASDNSNSNRVSFVDGLQNVHIYATIQANGFNNGSARVENSVLLNAISGTPTNFAELGTAGAGGVQAMNVYNDNFLPSFGFNFVQAMESSAAGGPSIATWLDTSLIVQVMI